MFKILVLIVSIATGDPVKLIHPSDEFESMEACLQFIAENREAVTAQLEQNSGGLYTLKAKCYDATPKVPA